MGRKIAIDPVTRIEGHARVTIHLDNEGRVESAHFHVDQFRGFEKFCEGRMYFEMPQITARICGICPVSHQLASAKACDDLIGAAPPRPAHLLRELMHMGQIIQSHSLHFFHLASPDLLQGFDANPALRNIVGTIQTNPDLALKGVALRKYGQEIIATLGMKRVHSVFAVPGGVNKALTVTERDALLAELDEMICSIQTAIKLIRSWLEENKDTVERFATFPSGYMGLVRNGALELYDGKVRLKDTDGSILEEFDGADYLDHIGERVQPWSYLKSPFYKGLGYPEGVYRVGPLGRLNVADRFSTPLANEELGAFKAMGHGKPLEASLCYHYARLIESLYAAERTRELLDDPDILSTDFRAQPGECKGEGIGVIEAPRGTLFHHYWADEDGKIAKVNLIVATGHNNWAMCKSVEEVAKLYVDGKRLSEGMLNRVEAAIRCYDPCLSCSTHALGQMPIVLELQDPDGEPVDRLVRG
jgi:NAD-reducing hydrogenase large subunit